MSYKTEQESFWAGKFGDEYINRNMGDKLLASNLNFFSKALNKTSKISSCIEFGANIGMNLNALSLIFPKMDLCAVEINEAAVNILKDNLPKALILNKSILDFSPEKKWDLVLIKGVLIHLNPDVLKDVYKTLYESSFRYILIAEYYNPTPVQIEYRGHEGKLFKRDFCGEILDQFNDLALVDYGFSYHRDNNFPQDDISWFLLEKGSR